MVTSDEIKLKQTKIQLSGADQAKNGMVVARENLSSNGKDVFQSPSLHERYNKVIHNSVSPSRRQRNLPESQHVSVFTTE